MTLSLTDCPHRHFDEPWHLQLYAITIALLEKRIIDWKEWSDWLYAELAEQASIAAVDEEEDYYNCWRAALEKILRDRQLLSSSDIRKMVNELTETSIGGSRN